jgi:peroxiredoxin
MAYQNGQEQSSKTVWVVPLVVLSIIVGLALAWRIIYAPAPVALKPLPEANQVTAPPAGQKPLIIESKEAAAQPIIRAQVTIDDIIRVRRHWNPAFMNWVGKPAPDFDLASIDGNDNKLSNCKGKTLMLIFWATWCGPCRMEIPDLIQLRNQVSPEKLAMLAVSFENGSIVRNFLSQYPVNYTVIAAPQSVLPPPFKFVNAIPTTFFIDKDGIIRLAAEGLVLPKEVQMILDAIGS